MMWFRWCYRILACCLTPGLLIYVMLRAIRKPAYRDRWQERLGRCLPVDHAHPLIWIHAVSLGESKMVIMLLEALKKTYPNYVFLLTSMTSSGSACQKKLVGDRVYHQYLPFDLWGCAAESFVDHYQPSIAIVVESDWWPGYLLALANRNIPLLIANMRISPKSYRSYTKLKPVFKAYMSSVHRFCLQDQVGFERLVSLGLDQTRSKICGNIKYDAIDKPSDNPPLVDASRHVFFAACTHELEETYCYQVWMELRQQYPSLLLILAPRHIERCQEVSAAMSDERWQVALLSSQPKLDDSMDILVVDQVGVLARCYAVADAVFLGGSFVDRGGHSPVEAAFLARSVVMGPSVFNIESMVKDMLDTKAIDIVANSDQLKTTVELMLKEPDWAKKKGLAAQAYIDRHKGALQRHLDEIIALL